MHNISCRNRPTTHFVLNLNELNVLLIHLYSRINISHREALFIIFERPKNNLTVIIFGNIF